MVCLKMTAHICSTGDLYGGLHAFPGIIRNLLTEGRFARGKANVEKIKFFYDGVQIRIDIVDSD
jgi:DNA polymerase sigma